MNSIIKHHSLYLLPAAALLLTHPGLAQQPSTPDETIREIRLIQDDAQTPIVSKIYELKHVKATDIRPFVLNAVTRFDSQSRVERVNYISAKRQLLIVSTAAELIPYIDDLIEKFDRPGKPDASGSIIAGTGITRLSYTPKHRAAQDIVDIINGALRTGTGIAYLNQDTNTIYWKDDVTSAKAILAWVKRLDRPRPQVTLRLNYYELRDSDLKDVGLDYLSWRNGPGLNLFAAGYSAGHLASTEAALAGTGILADLARDISQGWSRGGYFAAPQFDLSFVRLLRQSGKAKLVSSASLTLVNTPSTAPAPTSPRPTAPCSEANRPPSPRTRTDSPTSPPPTPRNSRSRSSTPSSASATRPVTSTPPETSPTPPTSTTPTTAASSSATAWEPAPSSNAPTSEPNSDTSPASTAT